MPLNILIDTTSITLKKAGVGIYACNLVHELVTRYPDARFYLVGHDDDTDFDHQLSNVTQIKVPGRLFRILPLRFLLEQIYLPLLSRRYRIDVVHSLHYSFPLLPLRARRVVTFHDMTSFTMPSVHIYVKMIYYRFFISRAVRQADHIIFVSQSALLDCRQLFHLPLENATVAHLGKSSAFKPATDRANIQPTLDRYEIPANYILYVGTIEPRKNLIRLVKAFASISARHPDVVLVIAGMMGWHAEELFVTLRKLAIEPKVIFTGYISETDKIALLQGAAIFAYPSLYEGFGIPILEAMACGIPTVTSNKGSLPEVAGDGALQVEPTDIDAIAEALEQVLSDDALRHDLQQRGTVQAARFTWQATVEQTMKVYRLSVQER